ncbi:MAG TPA: DUF1552 domain-containing protein [Polyangia bacterium]
MGGTVLGLPALDVFLPRGALAAAAAPKIYSAIMMQQNGSIQGHSGDPDLYWPKALGAISDANMTGTDVGQTTSELAGYASKLIFLRGQNFKFSNNHDGGPIACTCASAVTGPSPKQLPGIASADYFIAQAMTPGVEPLTLYAGKKGTYRDDAMSFSTGGKLRVGDNSPWNVYQRMIGMAGTAAPTTMVDPGLAAKMAARRLSVNDLIRSDLGDLLARTDLSQADRDRLDMHLTNIREMEINMTTTLGPMVDVPGMMAVKGAETTDDNMIKVVQFQLDLIVYAFATDTVRTATLQVGGCNDHTQYTINGVKQPPYHFISHRVMSDGDNGATIGDAINLHHEIDKIHARYFKHLLDGMTAYKLPTGGTLLDSSVNLWTNSIADGPPHGGNDVPHTLAGGAGGFLKTGQHIKSTGPSNRVLNTLISACGVTKAGGGPVDNFGETSAADGLITEAVA